MDVPVHYWIKDPIQNFKVRVEVRCVLERRPKVVLDGGNDADAVFPQTQAVYREGSKRSWAETFTWQEKKFGPRELVKYLDADENGDNKGRGLGRTAIEAEYREQLARRKRSGEDLLEDASQVMLFTFTDKDGFVPKNELTKFVTTSEKFVLNNVAESIVRIPETADANGSEPNDTTDDGDFASLQRPNKGKARVNAGQRIFRESPFKVFYLMAAVDVDTEILRGPEAKDSRFYEVVLCTLKVNREGKRVEMQPGFSSSRYLSVDNADSNKKSYRFQTPQGSVYEYSLTNEADSSDPFLEAEINTGQRENAEKVFESLEERVHNTVSGGPSSTENIHRYVSLEIVSAMDFDDAASDYLYIQYEVHLPKGGRWTWGDESFLPKRGVTQTSKCKYLHKPCRGDEELAEERRLTAHFSFPIEFQLRETLPEIDSLELERPIVCFQVKSRDIWERHRAEGYAALPLPIQPGSTSHILKTWKLSGSLRQQVSEYFVGGALQLDSSMYAALPHAHEGPFLNRYGFSTKTSGKLQMRLNHVVHRYIHPALSSNLEAISKENRKAGFMQGKKITRNASTSAGAVRRRTVAEILKSLKAFRGNQA